MADNSDPSGDSSGFFDGFWSVADKFAAPLAQAYVVGQNGVPGSENGMIQERLRFNALNGSGPVDPAAAQNSPASIWEFLTGQRGTTQAPSSGGGGLFLVAIVGLVAFLLLRRR